MTTPSFRRSLAAKAIDLPEGYGAVEELMRAFMKAVRAQQLYAANNPMYKTAIDALRTSFETVWGERDELVLTVAEIEMHWSGFPVYMEGPKSADNLAWLFYKDGVRELRFTPGVEQSEILRLLEIVGRARKASLDEDDLLTMLWEAEFTMITYTNVDVRSDDGDVAEVRDNGPKGNPGSATEVREAVGQAVASARPSGLVNMADFDQTLHFLDEREMDYLRSEIAREYQQDLRTNIIAALLDVFEQQTSDVVREEVLDHVETMLAFLLASGSFRGVAYLLAETTTATARTPDLSPSIRSRIASLPDRLSGPDVLGQLLEAIDDAPFLPPANELSLLMAQLRPTALATVFAWLPRVRSEQLRQVVAGVADRLAAANTDQLIALVSSDDAAISNEAMRRAGALKAQAAIPALSKVITDTDPRRRQLAAQALADIGSVGAVQALERCLADDDRDVRITAVRAIGMLGHKPALAKLESIVKGRDIRNADVTEKTAVFESYGAICGDAGVAHLDAALNSKGFLGKRDDPDMRAAAAVALGRIGTEKARGALQKSSTDKEPVVRNAVARALRGAGA